MNIKRILSCFMALSLFLTGPAIGTETAFAHDFLNDGVLEPEPDILDIARLATDRLDTSKLGPMVHSKNFASDDDEDIIITPDVSDSEPDTVDLVKKLVTDTLEENKQSKVSRQNAKNGWEVIHKKNFFNEEGIKCVCETNISEPVLNGFNENGQEIFRRKVEARTDFYFEETGEHLCSLFIALYFVHDGKSAKIEDNKLMIEKIYAYNDNWKISAIEGIYIASGQCVLTLFSYLNNKRTRERTDEFHADIVCYANGEIVFRNITRGPKEELNREGLKFTDLGLRTEQVRHNLIREVQETNIEQVRDLENDATDLYRYVRRDLDIVYKDNNGNVIADVAMHATFRYNIETHEVKCLGTHNTVRQGEADTSSRTGNETRTYGGAYGEVNLKYLTSKGREKKFEDKIVVKCDPRGSILSAFVKK